MSCEGKHWELKLCVAFVWMQQSEAPGLVTWEAPSINHYGPTFQAKVKNWPVHITHDADGSAGAKGLRVCLRQRLKSNLWLCAVTDLQLLTNGGNAFCLRDRARFHHLACFGRHACVCTLTAFSSHCNGYCPAPVHQAVHPQWRRIWVRKMPILPQIAPEIEQVLENLACCPKPWSRYVI